jgi:hypothetical protein
MPTSHQTDYKLQAKKSQKTLARVTLLWQIAPNERQQMNETKQAMAELAETLISNGRDTNNVLAQCNSRTGKANGKVGNHYTDTANDIYGIEQLLESILKANGCVNPRDSHATEMRAITIGNSMFFAELEQAVRDAFGPDRYPAVTLRVYLSRKAKRICNFPLKGHEDTDRNSPKPRAKYYLASE